MAFTVSQVAATVWGNKPVRFIKVTADAATDAIASGFAVVEHIAGFCPRSMTTASGKFKINVLSAGTASNGFIAITGIVSGDEFFLTVVGR